MVFLPLSSASNTMLCGRTASASLQYMTASPVNPDIGTAVYITRFYRDLERCAGRNAFRHNNRKALCLCTCRAGSQPYFLPWRPGDVKRSLASDTSEVFIAERLLKAITPSAVMRILPPNPLPAILFGSSHRCAVVRCTYIAVNILQNKLWLNSE